MANKIDVKELLEAGVHFGHMTRKWDPNMAPYIYMERNGIHIINLYKTAAKIEEAKDNHNILQKLHLGTQPLRNEDRESGPLTLE